MAVCALIAVTASLSGCGNDKKYVSVDNESTVTVTQTENTIVTTPENVTSNTEEINSTTFVETEHVKTEVASETVTDLENIRETTKIQQTSPAVTEKSTETATVTYEQMVANSQKNVVKYKKYCEEVLQGVNQIREDKGLEKLRLNDELSKAAMLRAMEMDYADKFSHLRPNGSKGFTILKEFNIKYTSAAENIACGYTTPAEVVKAWENSETHYNNMINESYTNIGIGYSLIDEKCYWVQLFAG